MINRKTEIASYNKNISSIIYKRLNYEMKNIDKISNDPEKYQEFKNLKVTNTEGLKLLVNFNYNNIDQVLEIRVPDSFPIDPPFIRIIKPKIKSNFVNNNGIINLPELSVKKWNSKIKLADILIKIFELLKISKMEQGEYDYDYENIYKNYCESILS